MRLLFENWLCGQNNCSFRNHFKSYLLWSVVYHIFVWKKFRWSHRHKLIMSKDLYLPGYQDKRVLFCILFYFFNFCCSSWNLLYLKFQVLWRWRYSSISIVGPLSFSFFFFFSFFIGVRTFILKERNVLWGVFVLNS